jgi:phospho-N-acetylmuramoyl-pentapeptide-transferase
VITNSILYLEAAKIFTYTALSFILALFWAPYLIDLLVWLKFWKKKTKDTDLSGQKLEVTKQFFEETDKRVPRAGGLLIWVTTLVFACVFWIMLKIEPANKVFQFLNFVNRRETFIPIGTLFFGSILGFVDDALATLETGGNYRAGGLKLSYRLGLVTVLSFLIGLWFHFKLGFTDISLGIYRLNLSTINLPGGINGSWLIILIVMIVLLGLFGSSMVDGFDGMSAGVFIPIYLCLSGLAFAKGFYDITTFLMVMVGTMAAYLWFNIPPARFYMGDTGTIGILLTMGVVALLLNQIYILPIAGIILVLTEASVIIQVFSKKVFKRKVFLAAPLHHHLEAKGWMRYQVTMRYWLVSIMGSVLALALGLLLG